MDLGFYQVDAFTDAPLAGNPAAVMPVDEWPDDDALLAIARENNLSETAFLLRLDAGRYHLRWFTPGREVDLCGHATLASAFVVFERLEMNLQSITFETASGELGVRRDGSRLWMDFPARPVVPWSDDGAVANALGATPVELLRTELDDPETDKILAVFEKAADVHRLQPDMAAIAAITAQGVVATAPGERTDFDSRYFAPRVGVPEDPVTGSAHCSLVPYWARRLGKQVLSAEQGGVRRGSLQCELQGGRVMLGGHAVLVIEGRFLL
jgi:PhzF family phenazine biosynthesis protein